MNSIAAPAALVKPEGAAAVDRALSLLLAFRESDGPLPLAELSRRTGLYKSTALRLLASLERAGLVQRLAQADAPPRYTVGPAVARLERVHRAQFSPDQVVLPVLHTLVAATGESAAYHVRQGQVPHQRRVCLYRVDSPQPVRDHVKAGDELPLDRGTGGRVLSAHGQGDDSRAPTAAERRLYAQIRAQGYCCATGDRLAEVTGVSAPVWGPDAQVVAALTLSMPAHRYREAFVAQVLAAARELSARLGA